jgi:hypothetical protein
MLSEKAMLIALAIRLSGNYAYQNNCMLKMMMLIYIRNTRGSDA